MSFGQGFQQGNKFGSPNPGQLSPTKHFPTYMDEFKYGFPSTGLSSCSNKWWGTEESQNEEQEESETENKASDALCSLRRKAVEEMKGKKGFEEYKLNKRQKMVLVKVFGASLPDQWKNIVS
ncbi:hypothetical protein LUZ60_009957 [Juncus effusus]|nr:hypothetical protein LUZ60_009957 [Juncus effusus]